MNLRILFSTLLLSVSLTATTSAPAAVVRGVDADAPSDAPMVLVATSVLDPSPYRQSVLLALPDSRGLHFGFVLNKITDVSIAQLFPQEHALARSDERVYLGGPALDDRLFALVHGNRDDNPGLIEVGRDLFFAAQADEVDRLLADRNRDAHFYVGMVVWSPGELEAELRAGAWEALEPKGEQVLNPEPDAQWRQLVALAHAVQTAVELHSATPRLFGRY